MTVVEVLVAIAIIAVAMACFLPATRRVREASAQAQCANNLKQIALGFYGYSDMRGTNTPRSANEADGLSGPHFPPGCVSPGTAPEQRLSWMVAILPYIEQTDLFNKFDSKKGYEDNIEPAQTFISIFHCTSGELNKPATTHYIAMAGVGADAPYRPTGAAGNGFMGFDRIVSPAVLTNNGTSNTIALMDTRTGLGPWARGGTSNVRGFEPDDQPYHGENRPFFMHERGMNAVMADGSVRLIAPSIAPERLAAAMKIAGVDSNGPRDD